MMIFIVLFAIEMCLPMMVATIKEQKGADKETLLDTYYHWTLIDFALFTITCIVGFVM